MILVLSQVTMSCLDLPDRFWLADFLISSIAVPWFLPFTGLFFRSARGTAGRRRRLLWSRVGGVGFKLCPLYRHIVVLVLLVLGA
jgi:hypothetical protein